MKHIFLNLKRFDIPTDYHGVNGIAPVREWGSYIVSQLQDALEKYRETDVEFAVYFPEAHILSAEQALKKKRQYDSAGLSEYLSGGYRGRKKLWRVYRQPYRQRHACSGL